MSIPFGRLQLLEDLVKPRGLNVVLSPEDRTAVEKGEPVKAVGVQIIGNREAELGENWKIISAYYDASEAMDKSPAKEK